MKAGIKTALIILTRNPPLSPDFEPKSIFITFYRFISTDIDK